MDTFLISIPIQLIRRVNINQVFLALSPAIYIKYFQNLPKLSSTLPNILSTLESFTLVEAQYYRLFSDCLSLSPTLLDADSVFPHSDSTFIEDYIDGCSWDNGSFFSSTSVATVSETIERKVRLFSDFLSHYKTRVAEGEKRAGVLRRAGEKNRYWVLAREHLRSDINVLETENFATLVLAVPRAQLAEFAGQYEAMDAEVVARAGLETKAIVPQSLTPFMDFQTVQMATVIVLRRALAEVKALLGKRAIRAKEFPELGDAEDVEDEELKAVEEKGKLIRERAALFVLKGFNELTRLHVHMKVAELKLKSMLSYGLNEECIVVMLRKTDEKEVGRILREVVEKAGGREGGVGEVLYERLFEKKEGAVKCL